MTKIVDDFTKYFAGITDPKERERLITRIKMAAVQTAPDEAMKPPVRTLGEYLASPIEVPPTLIYPAIVVRGEITATLGRAGIGKAQPLDSMLLKADGSWITMGSVKLGDELYDPATGGASTVVGIFPQGEEQVYRVDFSDGTHVLASGEHLWEVSRYDRKPRVLTTLELMDSPRRWSVPWMMPQETPETEVPLDPYTLGLLIGDGTLGGGSIIFSTADQELLDALELPEGITPKHVPGTYDYRLSHGSGKGSSSSALIEIIDGLGLRCSSANKIVPECYKRGSISQRQDILAGILDADGSPIDSGGAEFSTVSPMLAQDIAQIVRSLGGRAKVQHKRTTWTHRGTHHEGFAYRVHITFPYQYNPFRLERKAAKFKQWTKRPPHKKVVGVTPCGRAQTQCIKVNSARSTYVTDGYTVTHNTTMNLQRIIMWATGQPMYEDWKDQHGISYMSTENDRPIKTLIIENEGSAGMFHHKMGHLLTREGRLTDEQRDLAKENILIWGDGGYSGLKLDNDKHLSQVKAACDEWEPDILFVEPFRGLWTGEENSSTDMAVVIDNMIDIATEFGCGIILSHHERKSGVGDDKELMSAGRGSTVLEGAVATMENYQKVRGGDYREVTWSKKRYLHTPPPLRLEYDPIDTWYNYVPAELIEDQIIQVLTEAEGGPLSGSEIAELIEETKTKTNSALKKLTEAGRIKRRNGGQRPNGGGSRGYVYTLSGYSGSGDGGLEI
jgi:hypothetical protein